MESFRSVFLLCLAFHSFDIDVHGTQSHRVLSLRKPILRQGVVKVGLGRVSTSFTLLSDGVYQIPHRARNAMGTSEHIRLK